MGCCPSLVPGLTNISLSTGTNYLATRQSGSIQVRGTTATLGIKAGNVSGTSPSLSITCWQSFDGGATFKQTGSATTMTASGVTEAAFSGLTAALILIQVVFTGTSAYADVNVTVNFVTP
jgi:hypothetical protein